MELTMSIEYQNCLYHRRDSVGRSFVDGRFWAQSG